MMSKKIKVVVVDDAMFMRKAITEILESDPEMEVVDTARNGLEGVDKIKALQPDVVTLDIDMPVMDGLTAIRHLMIQTPIPIVVLSSLINDGAITFDALRLGVVDFVPKPSGAISADIQVAQQMIVDRIKMAATVHMENIRRVKLKPCSLVKEPTATGDRPVERLIAIGTNLSGPNTVIRLMSQLPESIPASIIVVQEISPRILPAFVRQFDHYTPWRVVAAHEGQPIESGVCYIHSNENSLRIGHNSQGEPVITLNGHSDEPLNHFFSSAADVFGERTVGVLLTGTGIDGSVGFSKIRENAGVTIAQDRKCCVFPNLTENVVRHNLVDMVLDEIRLPEVIQHICCGQYVAEH